MSCRLNHGLLFVVCVAWPFFSSCVPEKPSPVATQALKRLSPGEFPEFSDDLSFHALEIAMDQSVRYLKRLPPDATFQFGPDTFTVVDLIASLETFSSIIQQKPTPKALNLAIKEHFWVYRSPGRDGKGEILFTGYFEPLLRGSLTPSPRFPYPVYRKPDDWVRIDLAQFDPKYGTESLTGRVLGQTIVPYFSRKEIVTDGVLKHKGWELLWVSDPVDLFFLHVQGSGRVLLQDGSEVSVGYDATNGRPYRSIGTLLIDDGKISHDAMSMQKIKEYLHDHPQEIDSVLNHNERYVFFKRLDQGPQGALAVPLTAGRSIATDFGLFPKAALAFVETEKPVLEEGQGPIRSWESFGRFVLNHDTGIAIRGAGRVDFFWGHGPYAEVAAGHMKQKGALYFVVKKQDAGMAAGLSEPAKDLLK